MKRLEKGFTLIELMIVVAIIAILAAVAAPKFGVQMKKAHDAKGLAVVGSLRSAAQMVIADNIGGTTDLTYTNLITKIDDKSQGYVDASPTGGINATVVVGLNTITGTAATADGATEDLTHILLSAPTTTDGLISILGTGVDAKGIDWANY